MEILPTVTGPMTLPGLDPQLLSAQARAGDKQAIDRVATNFEGLFVSILLKEMRQTLQPSGMFGSDTSDVYGGLFDTYLGQHLAQSGALGIAKMIRHQLERTAHP